MTQYRAIFKVTREYHMDIEALSESHADAICQDMPLEDIERLGAGPVVEDVEIVSLLPWARAEGQKEGM